MKTVAHTTTPRKPYARVMYHATFQGQHGWALRDEQGACYFCGDDGNMILLHDTDAAALLLHGRVDLAAEARADDDVAAGLLVRAAHRTTTTRMRRAA